MSPRLVMIEIYKPFDWNQFDRANADVVINANRAGRHMGRPLREPNQSFVFVGRGNFSSSSLTAVWKAFSSVEVSTMFLFSSGSMV